jgi:capsular polysaccharide biosynthesis protein
MEEIDLKDLFEYFKGKISWIIISIAIALVIGNIYTMVTRVPYYKSSTSLVLVSEHGSDNSSYNTSEQQLNKNLVGTYSEIIKSKMVLNTVITNLGLNYTATELQNNITVSSVSNTEVIKITVSDPDNTLAAKISDETANVFVQEVNKFYKLNNVTILDKAEVSLKPYNVNYIKDNILYFIVGLILSCGVIFIFFYFDTTIKTSDEIEKKLGLTVIGTVPKVGKE